MTQHLTFEVIWNMYSVMELNGKYKKDHLLNVVSNVPGHSLNAHLSKTGR
jgi:hypothetical protein